MANTHTTLSSLFTDIADAIRSLKGTSASIVADDFPDEINAIPKKSSSDLTASGATVTAPAGYYASAASKSVAAGSATTPATTISSAPTISVSSVGLITASNSKTQSVTPTVSAGYVSAGTAGTITVSGSQTRQLLTKATETFTPGTTDQTIAKNVWTTGVQTIKGDANLVAENIAEGVTIFGVTGTHASGMKAGKGIIRVGTEYWVYGGKAASISFPTDFRASGIVACLIYNGAPARGAIGGPDRVAEPFVSGRRIMWLYYPDLTAATSYGVYPTWSQNSYYSQDVYYYYESGDEYKLVSQTDSAVEIAPNMTSDYFSSGDWFYMYWQ